MHFAAAALHAVVVNVNVSLAPPELAYVLADSGATVLVAAPEFAGPLADALAATGADAVPALRHVIWVAPSAEGTDEDGAMDAAAGFPPAGAPPALPGVQSAWYEAACQAPATAIGTNAADGGSAAGGFAEAGFEAARAALAAAEGFTVEDGFHMYYTSGTTGRPKGVVLSHRVVVLHALGTIKGAPYVKELSCMAHQ